MTEKISLIAALDLPALQGKLDEAESKLISLVRNKNLRFSESIDIPPEFTKAWGIATIAELNAAISGETGLEDLAAAAVLEAAFSAGMVFS